MTTPKLLFTEAALKDTVRLHAFLLAKNLDAADRAKTQIMSSLVALTHYPQAHKPVPNMPHQRDLIIKFGSHGYIARYRYIKGENVIILRIKHQRENDFS